MKYKIDDKVKCTFGAGEVKDIKNMGDMILYKIKLDNEKYKDKLLWFAEHELRQEVKKISNESKTKDQVMGKVKNIDIEKVLPNRSKKKCHNNLML